jgi:hypothetical protein
LTASNAIEPTTVRDIGRQPTEIVALASEVRLIYLAASPQTWEIRRLELEELRQGLERL